MFYILLLKNIYKNDNQYHPKHIFHLKSFITTLYSKIIALMAYILHIIVKLSTVNYLVTLENVKKIFDI